MRSHLATGFIAMELLLQARQIAQTREQPMPAEKSVGTGVLQALEQNFALSLSQMDAFRHIGYPRTNCDGESTEMGLVIPAST